MCVCVCFYQIEARIWKKLHTRTIWIKPNLCYDQNAFYYFVQFTSVCNQHLYHFIRGGKHGVFFYVQVLFLYCINWCTWFESQLRSTYFYNMYHISITLLLLKSMGSEKKLKMNLHQKKCIWKRIASIGKGSAVGTHCIYILGGRVSEFVCLKLKSNWICQDLVITFDLFFCLFS